MTDELIRAVVAILAVVVLVHVVMVVVFMPLGMIGGVMFGETWGWHGGTTGMLGAAVVWFVSLIVLVVVGYLLYRWFAGDGDEDGAMEELRVAYARGDLSKEEFEERRDLLRQE